jgi:hypothetical protein
MNYRKGFQRLYLVAAFFWFCVITFMVASDHWIWVRWRLLPTTWAALTKETYGTVISAPPEGFEMSPGSTAHIVKATPFGKVEGIVALSLPLPLAGYLMLFYVFPWVYAGFKRADA